MSSSHADGIRLHVARNGVAAHERDKYAEADLARAFEIDPTQDLVISNVLAWGPTALQPIAAASFLDGESEDRESLSLAMQVLEWAEGPIASRIRVRESMYEGWVAWGGGDALELIIRRGGIATAFELEPDAWHPLACQGLVRGPNCNRDRESPIGVCDLSSRRQARPHDIPGAGSIRGGLPP